MKKLTVTIALLTFLALLPFTKPAQAMKIAEFTQICSSTPMPCTDIPIIRAYVGGALDLLAALDEDTDYLADIYCKPTQELFDTAKIIQYMQAHQDDRPTRNAMMLVIQYVELEGGCAP